MVNATHSPALAARFNVTVFPTLLNFRRGRAYPFQGTFARAPGVPRMRHNTTIQRAAEINSEAMQEAAAGAVRLSSAAEVRALLEGTEFIVLAFLPDVLDAAHVPYNDAAILHRKDYKLHVVSDAALMERFNGMRVNVASVRGVMWTGQPRQLIVMHARRFHSKYEPKQYVLLLTDTTSADDIFHFIDVRGWLNGRGGAMLAGAQAPAGRPPQLHLLRARTTQVPRAVPHPRHIRRNDAMQPPRGRVLGRGVRGRRGQGCVHVLQ